MNAPSDPGKEAGPQGADAVSMATQAPEDQIGARIAERRLSKNLTHDGLAKLTRLFDAPESSKSGISRTTIRGYEVGMYKPGTREIRLLSQALEVSPTWLIFGNSGEDRADAPSPGASAAQEQTGLQKALIAGKLLLAIDAGERELLYKLLHSMARLKLGETEYRSAVISPLEVGGLLSDMWSDMREGAEVDADRLQEFLKAYQPDLESLLGSVLRPAAKPDSAAPTKDL